MTSKEALSELFGEVQSHKNQFDQTELIERVAIIHNDLEVLEILKRIVKIVDYSECPIDSPDNQLVILSGGRIMNVGDYDKIKEWLNNE